MNSKVNINKLRDFIQDWILGNDYCKGCLHSFRDQYGNMCLYDSPIYPFIRPKKCIITRDISTHKSECNLYERSI